jgi:hypothetical protein
MGLQETLDVAQSAGGMPAVYEGRRWGLSLNGRVREDSLLPGRRPACICCRVAPLFSAPSFAHLTNKDKTHYLCSSPISLAYIFSKMPPLHLQETSYIVTMKSKAGKSPNFR